MIARVISLLFTFAGLIAFVIALTIPASAEHIVGAIGSAFSGGRFTGLDFMGIVYFLLMLVILGLIIAVFVRVIKLAKGKKK